MEDGEYESEVDEWNDKNSTGQSCGICSSCGSNIYQSTYADYCKCGEQDYAY